MSIIYFQRLTELFLTLKLQTLQPIPSVSCHSSLWHYLMFWSQKSEWQNCYYDYIFLHDILLIYHKVLCLVTWISQLTHPYCENVTWAFMPITTGCQKSSWSVILVLFLYNHVILTSLTGASQVSCPWAVANVAVPALPADAVVLAGVGQTLFGWLSRAWGLHTHRSLGLCQPSDVFALPVHKQVSDATHITVVQQSRPHLRKE